MVRKLSDDEVMDSVYKRLFGDLDSIEGKTLFSDSDSAINKVTENAKPEDENSGGISITVKPLMKDAEESGRMADHSPDGGEEDEDKLKGISNMSPLMAQLHRKR